MKAAIVLLAAFVLTIQGWSQATTLYSIGQPTDEEQLYLEFINQARANPTAEGERLATTLDPDVVSSIDFFDVNVGLMKEEFAALPVRPPLAMNVKLLQMARAHTQDMFINAFQDHASSNGDDIVDRAQAVSYPFSGIGENVYSNAFTVFHGHAGFQIDWGEDNDGMQEGRGHRVSIHNDYREIGVGVILGSNTKNGKTVGPQLVTQNFGTQHGSLAYVTGVVYYDLNGNDFYDLGEGIGGLTVNVVGSSFHAVTSTSGGYAVPVPTTNLTRAVAFSGLGLNGGADAVIADGKNEKVDFKPVFTPITLNGPASMEMETSAVYTFNSVGGATGYEWLAAKLNSVADDGAENLDRVMPDTTGSYTPRSTTVKHAGSSAYRLTHPAVALSSERLTYSQSFFVQADASLSFRSRLRMAAEHQIARVQVSTDNGASWSNVYSQAGATPEGEFGLPGEASFQLRQVSLAAFEGQQIRIRFSYDFAGGSLFPGTGDTVGWYVDAVTFTNIVGQDEAVIIPVVEGETEFEFNPVEEGDYLLGVRPIISGRAWAFGEQKTVAVNRPAVDITVRSPTDVTLVSGMSSVSLGTVAMGASQASVFTVINSGSGALTNLAVSMAGTHMDDFIPMDLEADNLPVDGEMTLVVQFAPTAVGNRTAVLQIASDDPNENPFLVTLTGSGTQGLVITQPPQSQVVRLGDTASFDVVAGPPGLTYQWKKNNAVIKNATAADYDIAQVKMTDAGAYSVLVTGGLPVSSDTSTVANLGVVEDIEKTIIVQEGKAVSLTVKATGADLTYEWKKDGQVLVDSEFLIGRETKTLTLKDLLSAQSGTYTCELKTGDSLPTAGATTHLRVFNDEPQILLVQGMQDGVVGGDYHHQIQVQTAFALTPLSYAVKNLPPGLKLNAKTGEITGRPTKAQTYQVTVIAINPYGSSETTEEVVVSNYPANLAGAYVGWVGRHAVMNQMLGGRLDLKITNLGAFSGSLTMGTTKLAFKGVLDILADGSELPHAEVFIQPPGKPLPAVMKLVFHVDHEQHELTDSTVTQGGQVLPVTGWHQAWSSKGIQAKPFLGLHTFGLRLPDLSLLLGDDDIPQGWGFGSFSPGLDGKVTVAGRMADGEKFTSASFVGPQGEVLIFKTLYTTPIKGSVLGTLVIDPGGLPDVNDTTDNSVSGDLTWTRPANLKLKTYSAGFGLTGTPGISPVPLTAVGARFVPPQGVNAVILNLLAGANNARVAFDHGDIDSSSDDPDQDLNIGLKSKITPFDPATNLAGTKLTANIKTGTLSGGFALTDSPVPGAKDVKRSVALQGMLIRDGEDHLGVGYFLLGGLSNGPILSGKMELAPK